MASVYGKVREESGIVIDSIADSLAKLSVYAENNYDERIGSRVDGLVRGRRGLETMWPGLRLDPS